MEERLKKLLLDILNAIEEIDSFLGEDKNFKIFQGNLLLKRGIERNLEIIGEAVNRINKEFPMIKINHTRAIIGLRNRIVHAYDNLSYENIWGIIINHLPLLKLEIQELYTL